VFLSDFPLGLSLPRRSSSHDGFDRQGVRYEVGAFYMLRKDRPCFFAGGFVGHNVSILSNGFGTWEKIFYGEFDGGRRKRVLVKVIGE
jgi:hypothetical protein